MKQHLFCTNIYLYIHSVLQQKYFLPERAFKVEISAVFCVCRRKTPPECEGLSVTEGSSKASVIPQHTTYSNTVAVQSMQSNFINTDLKIVAVLRDLEGGKSPFFLCFVFVFCFFRSEMI